MRQRLKRYGKRYATELRDEYTQQILMFQEYNVEARTTPVFHVSLRMQTGEVAQVLAKLVTGETRLRL